MLEGINQAATFLREAVTEAGYIGFQATGFEAMYNGRNHERVSENPLKAPIGLCILGGIQFLMPTSYQLLFGKHSLDQHMDVNAAYSRKGNAIHYSVIAGAMLFDFASSVTRIALLHQNTDALWLSQVANNAVVGAIFNTTDITKGIANCIRR